MWHDNKHYFNIKFHIVQLLLNFCKLNYFIWKIIPKIICANNYNNYYYSGNNYSGKSLFYHLG